VEASTIRERKLGDVTAHRPLRTSRWKPITNRAGEKVNHHPFNLHDDLGEEIDVASIYRARVARMWSVLETR
jgi:hypothetical protein